MGKEDFMRPDLNHKALVTESGGGAAVAHFGYLHGVAFAAVGDAPELPVGFVADGVAGAPEVGGVALVGGR